MTSEMTLELINFKYIVKIIAGFALIKKTYAIFCNLQKKSISLVKFKANDLVCSNCNLVEDC